MIFFKKEKIINLINYLKNKKVLIIIFFISFIISIIFLINYFNLLKLQQNVLKSEIDLNYKNLIVQKINQINNVLNNINKILMVSYYQTDYDYFIINELSKIDYIDSSFVVHNLSKLRKNINEYFEKEKDSKEFEVFNLAVKAFNNNLYELSLSYLFSIINSDKDLIYIKLRSYYYIAKIYYMLGIYDNSSKFAFIGIKFLFLKEIFDEVLIDFYQILYDIYYNFNLKKNFAFNIFLIKSYFNLSEDKISNDVRSFFQRYCRKENELILNNINLKDKNIFFNVKDYFLNYYSMIKESNIVLLKKNKSFIDDYFVFVAINFKTLLNNEIEVSNSSYYYFNLLIDNEYFLNNKEGFNEFDKISILFSTNDKPVYISLFVEKTKMVNFLTKKQYFLGTILILILFVTGIVSIIIVLIYFLKEYELNIMKSEFISIVSHELKTPITTIQLVADSIIRNYERLNDEKKLNYIGKIKSESQRLLYLINNLLTFTKNEQNKKYVVLKELDFIPILNEVIDLFKISKKNINFILDFSFKNMIILGDGDLLKQVIYNIIDNSYKYSGEEKIIKINIYEKGNQYFCEFIDNGFGIDEEDLKKVFEKFYRGKNTLNVPGTGLGLALIKYIIDYHGAKILIDSKKGVGTKVTLIFNKYKNNLEEEKNG